MHHLEVFAFQPESALSWTPLPGRADCPALAAIPSAGQGWQLRVQALGGPSAQSG